MTRSITTFALTLGLFGTPTHADDRSELLGKINKTHNLTQEQAAGVKKIFDGSSIIGQGNPQITKHPASVEECKAKLESLKLNYKNPEFEKICGAPYMAPLYNPATESPKAAKACIDQFEFPNIPCEYPVVWIKAVEAADVCNAMGKRLCDAHEWEGACDGALFEPDYPFDHVKGLAPSPAVKKMRTIHNAKQKPHWAYGDKFTKGICGQNSVKFADCNGGDWKRCGSNTYPLGFFPDCKSKLEVYDQHGNAAEHMNLPLNEDEMASKGSTTLGHTEMKGSWFIWDKFQAHQDYCRWRAPYWHGTRVRDPKSHHNYHLGFRCCKTLP
jgi:hypothetical protein